MGKEGISTSLSQNNVYWSNSTTTSNPIYSCEGMDKIVIEKLEEAAEMGKESFIVPGAWITESEW
jgi:translation elongation factor EF-1alpha